jgi:hypothetical protein
VRPAQARTLQQRWHRQARASQHELDQTEARIAKLEELMQMSTGIVPKPTLIEAKTLVAWPVSPLVARVRARDLARIWSLEDAAQSKRLLRAMNHANRQRWGRASPRIRASIVSKAQAARTWRSPAGMFVTTAETT